MHDFSFPTFFFFCQSKNSVTATKFSSFSSLEVSKLKEHDTFATAYLQTNSIDDTKACRAGKPLKEKIHKQYDEQKPAIRPRLTLKGPYSGLLTVDTPANCLQRSCHNFSSYNDHSINKSNCFNLIDHTGSSLEQSNIKDQVIKLDQSEKGILWENLFHFIALMEVDLGNHKKFSYVTWTQSMKISKTKKI